METSPCPAEKISKNIVSGPTKKRNGGGGVYTGTVPFVMSDGEISNNTGMYNGRGDDAGGIDASHGNFTMSGGTISGNYAPRNGSEVYHRGEIFAVSGNAEITQNNTYLLKDRQINVTAAFTGKISNITLDDNFKKGSKVVALDGVETAALKDRFTLGDTRKDLSIDSKALVFFNNMMDVNASTVTIELTSSSSSNASFGFSLDSYTPSATGAYVNLTSGEETLSTYYTEQITAGNSVSDIVVSGLKP